MTKMCHDVSLGHGKYMSIVPRQKYQTCTNVRSIVILCHAFLDHVTFALIQLTLSCRHIYLFIYLLKFSITQGRGS